MEHKGEQGKLWWKRWSCYGWWNDMSANEATLNNEEIKPVAIAIIIELHFSECIYLVSQSVSQKILWNKKFLKLHSNLIPRFRVDLKTFLDLATPNQCHPIFTKWIFGVIQVQYKEKLVILQSIEIIFTKSKVTRVVTYCIHLQIFLDP